MLKGKTVSLGVTDGTVCYKSAGLASALVKQGANVQVLTTRNTMELIGPYTFESLTGNWVSVDTFDRSYQFQMEHIVLADQADLVLVALATANVLTKPAHGLTDDMLITAVLACDCPKIAAPTTNTRMYENPVVQGNLVLLRRYGWEIMESASGRLVCGAVGEGKMPEPEELLEMVLHALSHAKDMEGLKVLATADPTQEALDPVCCLINYSTGRMGYVVARAAVVRGAEVTPVSGPTALKKPAYVETVDVVSAQDMSEAVTARAPEQDTTIKAVAVADYCPVQVAQDKVKKGEEELSIPLERTRGILAWLGEHRGPGQFLRGFSVEIWGMVENSCRKLEKKHLDLTTANNLREPGAGLAVSTNLLTSISPREEPEPPLLTKEEVAHRLLDEILKLR